MSLNMESVAIHQHLKQMEDEQKRATKAIVEILGSIGSLVFELHQVVRANLQLFPNLPPGARLNQSGTPDSERASAQADDSSQPPKPLPFDPPQEQ